LRLTDSIGRGLDAVAEVPAWSMTAEEQREALVTLRRERIRLHELELRVLAEADRGNVGEDSGATSTAAWLAHETKTTRSAAYRDVHLAHALDVEFAATRAAMADGAIDALKARIIVHAVNQLTTDYGDVIPVGTRARAEAHLVDYATVFDATRLRMLGKRLLEVVCPEAADAAEGRKLEEEERRGVSDLLCKRSVHLKGT